MVRTSALQRTCDDIIMTSAAHYSQSQRKTTLATVDKLREDFGQCFHRWHDVLQPSPGDEETTSLGTGDSRIDGTAQRLRRVFTLFFVTACMLLWGDHIP